jgi:hypothetical protein
MRYLFLFFVYKKQTHKSQRLSTKTNGRNDQHTRVQEKESKNDAYTLTVQWKTVLN